LALDLYYGQERPKDWPAQQARIRQWHEAALRNAD